MSILLITVLLQVFVITIIVAILKAILGKNLTEMAVRRLELWDEEAPVPDQVRVISQRPLGSHIRMRIETTVAKRFGSQIPCRFDCARGIWGGLKLEVGQRIVDFTVRDRWRQAFGR